MTGFMTSGPPLPLEPVRDRSRTERPLFNPRLTRRVLRQVWHRPKVTIPRDDFELPAVDEEKEI